jgi:CRISPR-associated protein Cas5 subtype I-B
MKGATVKIEGNWAHFKKPETNNNPLTHDFITKTAFIGLIGAVLGIEREAMRPLFPQLSEDLLYGVQMLEAVKKESWSFKLRYAANLYEKRPVQMEFLKNPQFLVAVALQNERSSEIFQNFLKAVGNSEARFTPVLGLHNCPANLSLSVKGEFTKNSGSFKTRSFVTSENHDLKDVSQTKDFRIGLDKIPTYQNEDFWNLPERYKQVLYPAPKCELSVDGEYFRFTDGSNWVLL